MYSHQMLLFEVEAYFQTVQCSVVEVAVSLWWIRREILPGGGLIVVIDRINLRLTVAVVPLADQRGFQTVAAGRVGQTSLQKVAVERVGRTSLQTVAVEQVGRTSLQTVAVVQADRTILPMAAAERVGRTILLAVVFAWAVQTGSL